MTCGKGKKLSLNNGFEYREQIESRGNGLTVLAYLTRNHRHSSRADWQARLDAGQILIDGRRTGPDAILKNGQSLLWRRPPWDEPDAPLFYSILHEDEDLLAVAKPCGLPTLPGGGFLEHTLLALVRKNHPEANPLHRLGRGTSGIVLFARTARAKSDVCAAWRRKEVRKIYRGLATGCPDEDNFIIDTPIGPVPHPKIGTVNAACPDGKFALSKVRVLERRNGVSLLEIRIRRAGLIRSAFTFHLQGTRWWETVSTRREEPSMIRRRCPEIPAIFCMPNVFVLIIRQRDYPSKSSALLLPSLRVRKNFGKAESSILGVIDNRLSVNNVITCIAK